MGSFLSQEEIDALLNGNSADTGDAPGVLLSPAEEDVLSEIGNINAGSASTALSELLNQRVLIDTPHLNRTSPAELQKGFVAPYILVEVEYSSGLEGSNVFILQARDAAIIASLMMGGDGINYDPEMNEITLSAVSEAMNQMIGYSATALSKIFNRTIEISPPKITLMNVDNEEEDLNWNIFRDEIIVISFNLEIGTLLKSEIMLIMNLDVAKQQVEYLMDATSKPQVPAGSESPQPDSGAKKTEIQPRQIVVEDQNGLFKSNNLNLILDIPLKLSVILGRTKRNIADVLRLNPGSIVELDRLENEPVDILVNDTLIARGEVVVVKEYFGVRITDIISTENRIKSLVVK
ncbi:MAG: flagellar motor switch phosphatase FliY [Syntrophomonadaceae bacterium]|nr:flagellar motor switch phosphatase FliY [Syntrophomonadaceae bacterium]